MIIRFEPKPLHSGEKKTISFKHIKRSLTDLAARSSARASGPRRASSASLILTMASVRCSSRGVSEVASNGTMLSVKDSVNCNRDRHQW